MRKVRLFKNQGEGGKDKREFQEMFQNFRLEIEGIHGGKIDYEGIEGKGRSQKQIQYLKKMR